MILLFERYCKKAWLALEEGLTIRTNKETQAYTFGMNVNENTVARNRSEEHKSNVF